MVKGISSAMSLEVIVWGDTGANDCWCFLRQGPGSSATTAGRALLVALMKRDSRLWFRSKRQMRGKVCVYVSKEGKYPRKSLYMRAEDCQKEQS